MGGVGFFTNCSLLKGIFNKQLLLLLLLFIFFVLFFAYKLVLYIVFIITCTLLS